ncbi:Eukaryotic translation initiation factor 3 subunit C-like protein, partial [Leptotrombidium deliense]
MSGRFFKPQFDSESESEESEPEVQPQRPAPTVTATYAFSDEEEETKRVVRTEKEKRYEELHSMMKLIRNHTKIKDISKMLTGFENLTKAFLKAKPVIEKEENGITPRFYIKCLVELDDFITDVWEDREGRKNMSKNNSKSLATLRQKLRKYNKDFENEIIIYRENPDEEKDDEFVSEQDSEEESDDEGSESKFVQKGSKKVDEEKKIDDTTKDDFMKSKFVKGTASDDEKDSEESDWGSSDDDSSLSSDYDNQEVAAYIDCINLFAYFIKIIVAGKKKIEEEEDEGEWEKVKGGTITGEKPKMFAKDEEITHQSVVKKLSEILAMRGKKRIHRSDQIDMLSELLDISEAHKLGPGMRVKIVLGVISALLDYNTNISTCMKPEMWETCIDFCNRLVDTLIAHPEIAVGENIAEESESFANPPFRVHGCALTLVERIDEEFTKILQAVDAHSPDYIERLKDEKKVCSIIERLQYYLETDQRGTSSELCRVYILRIDHLYYKFDPQAYAKKTSIAMNCRSDDDIENEGK